MLVDDSACGLDVIGHFRQQLTQHYAADMMLGPLALLETIAAQCRLIGGLIDAADGPTRRNMARSAWPIRRSRPGCTSTQATRAARCGGTT
ncbi:hypothetical protein ACFF2X_03020 [Cryptosporangium minutisporangium]